MDQFLTGYKNFAPSPQAQLQGALALGERRKQEKIGQLGQRFLSGDQQALGQIASRSPEKAVQYQKLQTAQAKQQKEKLTKSSALAQMVLDADPEERAEVYRATMNLAPQYKVDTSELPDTWSPEAEKYLQNVVDLEKGLYGTEEKVKAQSTVGKIQDDIDSGAISKEVGQRAIAKATSIKPLTQVVIKGEEEEQKGLGKYRAKQYETTQDASLKATDQNQMLNIMEESFNDPDVYTGKGAEFVADAKKTAAAFGFKLRGLTSTAKIESLSNQMALKARGKDMPGSMSEKDREFLKNIVPGLKKTREGNIALIGINKKLNSRKIEIANLQDEYLNEKGTLRGFPKFKREYVKRNPLFKEGEFKAKAKKVNNDPLGIR